MRLSWWRFRSTFGRRWSGYLAVVLLVALLGGLSMGAVAGARRTQSSFPVYLASTNPSDVQFFAEFAPSTNIGYSAGVDRAIARVPYVRKSVVVVGFDGTLQVLGSLPHDAVPGEAPPSFEGSLNGEYATVDKVTLSSRVGCPIRGALTNSLSPPAGPRSTACTSDPPCRSASTRTSRRTRRASPATPRQTPSGHHHETGRHHRGEPTGRAGRRRRPGRPARRDHTRPRAGWPRAAPITPTWR